MKRLVSLVCLALVACGAEPPPPRFAVAFYTESDPSLALAGVEILANGQTVGTSDDTGLVQAILEGREGTPFNITWNCPEGYRPPEAPQTLRLRSFQGLSPDAATGLTMTLGCPPVQRHVGFVIRTNRKAGIVVKLDGTEVARTNEAGVAHASREAAVGTTFSLELITPDGSNLRPARISRSFTLPDEDSYYVFDQDFEASSGGSRVRSGSNRRHRPRHTGPRRTRPRRTGPQKIRRVPMLNHF